MSILSIYQVLFAIPLIYFSYLAIKNKEVNLPKSSWFLFAFFLIALLSLVLNFEIIPKPSKNFGRLKYYLYGLGGIFVFRMWLKDATDKTKQILVNTFLLTVVVAALVVIFDYVVTPPPHRAKGLTDTMRYGYGSGMFLLMILSGILHHKKISQWFNWKFALVAFVLGFAGMYVTFTRGALLGFLSGLPFVLYFYRPKLGIAFSALGIVAGCTLFYFYQFGEVKQGQGNRFLMTKNNSGDEIRRSQWQAAIISIKERPVLGWGLSNFHSQLPRIKNDYDLPAKEYNDAHAHNLFLETGAGTGLVGLLLFVGWLFMWAFECFKKGGMVRNLIVPFGAALVVSSQFEVTFDANNASMIFFLYALSTTIQGEHVQQS